MFVILFVAGSWQSWNVSKSFAELWH